MNPKNDGFGFLIADVSRLMRRGFEERIDAGTLTLAEARALVYMAAHPNVRQVELAALLDVQPITLCRVVDSLEEKRLVERRADPNDGRAHRLHLLPKAHSHLAVIDRIGDSLTAQAMQDIDKRDAERAIQVLLKMRRNLSSQ